MQQVSLDSFAVAVLDSWHIPTPVIFGFGERSSERFWEFFTANIRNRNTRKAYFIAADRFSRWCEERHLTIQSVRSFHVAAYIEQMLQVRSKPTVKMHLAALRSLFDWMVVGQIIEQNPARAVRGPRYSVRKGKTPVLTGEEARGLLDSIDASTLLGKRDRALIAVMTYAFARIGAVLAMQVGDYYVIGRRGKIRLHEKGGKEHEVPCHHNLDECLEAYISAAGIGADLKGLLFRSSPGNPNHLTSHPMAQNDAYRMIQRRAKAAGITARIGNHTFRATGITAYLKNGGRLEVAQQIAAHESPRTTSLYDRRNDEISLDEVERIVL